MEVDVCAVAVEGSYVSILKMYHLLLQVKKTSIGRWDGWNEMQWI